MPSNEGAPARVRWTGPKDWAVAILTGAGAMASVLANLAGLAGGLAFVCGLATALLVLDHMEVLH